MSHYFLIDARARPLSLLLALLLALPLLVRPAAAQDAPANGDAADDNGTTLNPAKEGMTPDQTGSAGDITAFESDLTSREQQAASLPRFLGGLADGIHGASDGRWSGGAAPYANPQGDRTLPAHPGIERPSKTSPAVSGGAEADRTTFISNIPSITKNPI